jgi:hypothetical protein
VQALGNLIDAELLLAAEGFGAKQLYYTLITEQVRCTKSAGFPPRLPGGWQSR